MSDSTDVPYWNRVYDSGQYKRGKVPVEPSSFASFVLPYVKPIVETTRGAEPDNPPFLVEWGCGNGRDARFFAEHGLKVVATDLSSTAIAKMSSEQNSDIVFREADFTDKFFDPFRGWTSHDAPGVCCVYSRFSIHSVSEAGASRGYEWAWKNLMPKGIMAIETRSIQDPLCGVGSPVDGERHAWIEDHYRRFSIASELRDELVGVGFEILFIEEKTGFARYKEEDPCCIRIIAAKT